ncbi:MAG: DNA-directed RNA polymerase [Candidatus Methanoliparum thermophilum]|uniref:DNA-directed RNA polymerase subunit Rpo7 n=1 Tax=Methanoliparum thermophilum TaxID=2491083 RepID=A0A520KSC5_METT2|nr:DNA-directed RNA polymerase [Candidatus Methanoliparum sp. LAM-1]RZN64122.1 MAG: DNA-directed RNA polymerase [Candidatus Methanoliparum thermophilum]BDC35615.1 DNA-directed RNA polymerase [Candidatus Methanoliparum sp. LAM-1]
MYKKLILLDAIRVPPDRIYGDTRTAIKEELKKKLEGRIEQNAGLILTINEILDIDNGHILFGDAGVYFNVKFSALAYEPLEQEIVEGEVIDVVKFGIFVNIGPFDGLVHISQISGGYISYDEKNARLIEKDSKRSITVRDIVRARITTVSINEFDVRSTKINLTMRQPYLGKLEWIQEELEKDASMQDMS